MSPIDSLRKAGVRKRDSSAIVSFACNYQVAWDMIWPLIYPTHAEHNQRVQCSCESNWVSCTQPFLLVPLLQVLPSWAIPSDLLQTLLWWASKSGWRPASALNLFPRAPAHWVGPGLSTSSLIFHLSCWVDTLHKGCVPKAVVCKSGSSSCFQGHRGGWAGQRHRWAWGALPCFPGAACLVVSHTEFLPHLWGKFCCSERLQRV